jgi:hypothetical protein
VGCIADQSIGQRIVSIPPAFMYLTSFSVSVVCGTIPKKPFGATRDALAVDAAEAGVVVPCERR